MYVVIAGAGLVGRGLAERLLESKHDVVIVEQNRAVCDWLVSHLGVLTICGSAMSIEILEQAGIAKADVAVATMRADADNLSFSLLAKSFDVPRVVARIRNRRYEAAYRQAGVSTTVQIADVFANQIMLDIEEPHLQSVATFGGGKASIVVDTLPEGALAAGRTVRELAADEAFPPDCIITGIYRAEEQQFLIPRRGAQILAGDRLFLDVTHRSLRKASKFLHKKH